MGIVVYDPPTRSAVQKIKYISEGNVYRLVAGSKLPAAEKFESWVFDELVAGTLKHGGYLLGKTAKRITSCLPVPYYSRTVVFQYWKRKTMLPF